MNTLLVLAAIVLGGVLLCVLLAFVIDQVRMGRHRGVPRKDFVQKFVQAGVPDEIPAVVYEYYQSRGVIRRFQVSPDDTYDWMLEGEEEIETDARDLVKQLRLNMPSEGIPMNPAEKIQTLRDMVLWLDRVRRQQTPNTSS